MQTASSSADQAASCAKLVDYVGGTVVATYFDPEQSGYRRNRPGLQKLLRDVEDGKVDIVVCEALDRLARDAEDLAFLGKKLMYHRVALHTVSEGHVDEIKFAVAGLLGAIFLKHLIDKTVRGMEAAVLAGRFAGGRAYGLKRVIKLDGRGDASELRRWFAEDVSIEPKVGGAFVFAGDGAYQPTSTTLTCYEPGRLLSWEWPLHGVVGEVTVEVTPKDELGASRVDVTSRFPELPDMPRARELVDDLWRFHLGNLKALTKGGERVLLPDFGDPTLEVRQSIHIEAPRAAVFQALVDPAMLKEWTMIGRPDVELRVGGKYSYGWVYEAGDKTVHGGPTRILDLEQDARLVTDWLDWRGDDTNNCQRITWLLEDDGGGTKLTLVHDGFARAADISDFPFGWIGFLEGIKRAVAKAQTATDVEDGSAAA